MGCPRWERDVRMFHPTLQWNKLTEFHQGTNFSFLSSKKKLTMASFLWMHPGGWGDRDYATASECGAKIDLLCRLAGKPPASPWVENAEVMTRLARAADCLFLSPPHLWTLQNSTLQWEHRTLGRAVPAKPFWVAVWPMSKTRLRRRTPACHVSLLTYNAPSRRQWDDCFMESHLGFRNGHHSRVPSCLIVFLSFQKIKFKQSPRMFK